MIEILSRNEVTYPTLEGLFANAGIESKIDSDGDGIYLKGLEAPCWIFIDQEEGYVLFQTSVLCKENVPPEEIIVLPEVLNESNVLVTFTYSIYEDGRLYLNGHHCLYFAFDLNIKNFLFTARTFASMFANGLRHVDSDEGYFESDEMDYSDFDVQPIH